MSLLSYLGFGKKSATTARDRLQVIIAQERKQDSSQDYLPMLRKEIMEVIAKYTKADMSKVKVDLHHDENSSVLELNVALPEHEEATV
jgi:cell division topological specificity factor